MDKIISKEEKRKENIKKSMKYIIPLIIVIIVFIFGLGFLESSISRKSITIRDVDSGDITITVSARGLVVPLNEKIIVAPINTRILEVYKNAGDSVNEGEPILKLELASIETEYNQKIDEGKIQRSKLTQSQISISNKLSEMNMEYKIKEMKLKQMATDLKNEQYLDSIGASTKDKIREKQLNHDVARLELSELKQKIENEKRNSVAEQNVLELEYNIFEKNLAETARLLKDARILAPMKGSLTYVNDQLGTQVSIGTQIATVSDLTRFKIEGEIADTYADKISAGSKAIVKIGTEQLLGTVVNITPSSQNGVIKFIMNLNDVASKNLRSGLKTDLYVQHGVRSGVLRIPVIPNYFGPGKYDIWVMKDNVAEIKQVMLGEGGFENIEVISGLEKGDQIITSNMDNYKDKKTLKIK